MSGIGSIISGVGDLFASSSYGKAASLYGNDIEFAKESTALKQVAANRQIFQTMGATRAEVGGSGLKAAGSALDILRSSAQQASQFKGQIAVQGAIDENHFAAEQASAEGMQTVTEFSGAAAIAGGLTNMGASGQFGSAAQDLLTGG